jgi:queuine/archaeosine tRNA-ribosyltransferase
MRLATLRSLQYYQDLMEGIRSTLAEGRFAARKMETLARLAEGVWTPPAVPAKERRERSIR